MLTACERKVINAIHLSPATLKGREGNSSESFSAQNHRAGTGTQSSPDSKSCCSVGSEGSLSTVLKFRPVWVAEMSIKH